MCVFVYVYTFILNQYKSSGKLFQYFHALFYYVTSNLC